MHRTYLLGRDTSDEEALLEASRNELIEYIRIILLRSGIRTSFGFELVGIHNTTGLRYVVSLPYSTLNMSEMYYRRVDETHEHHLGVCTIPFLRAIAAMLLREHQSRTVNMNVGASLPESYADLLHYMAAGFNMKEARKRAGLSTTQAYTAVDRLKRAWQSRSMNWVITKYLLAQANAQLTDPSTLSIDTAHALHDSYNQ